MSVHVCSNGEEAQKYNHLISAATIIEIMNEYNSRNHVKIEQVDINTISHPFINQISLYYGKVFINTIHALFLRLLY